ncbi:hypothetical protein [Spiroplasma endosymbiont of Lariophagus distinguendus]|uniref:hypothetical protein n=1 Tax=Spiroplasma endosymbiont of Lariophagus distinguendus TaxID=2935082 RepID=UPI002079E1CE|nr:hypothetical protein [Spiroplasma endosymbiont of Lariophagus distinguendus]
MKEKKERFKIILETATTNVSITDIENKIKKFKESLIIFKKEFTFIINESVEEQRNYKQEFKKTLSEETLENDKYEKDLFDKEDDLKKLKSDITELEKSIINNKLRNQTLNEKMANSKKELKKINWKIKGFQKEKEKFKEKSINIDKDTFRETQENIKDFQATIRTKKKYVEVLSSLIEVDSADANIQKQWDALWTNYDNKVKEATEIIQILEKEISDIKKQISKNEVSIKEQEKELKVRKQEQSKLENEVKEVKEKSQENVKEIRSKLTKINNKIKNCFTKNKLDISKKSNDIVNLFNEFKTFNEKIKEDFTFLIAIKEQINKFLGEYFLIKNSKDANPISIVNDYDAELKAIIQNFISFCGENKYGEVLKSIKQFNNYKENNDQQELQPSTSSESNTENNGNCKLFDFKELELEPGSLIKMIPNYNYFLEEHKGPYSYLIFIKDDSLNEDEIQKQAKNLYFNPLLLFEDCNEEEQIIFKKLQNKIAKNNKKSKKSFLFNKDKKFALLVVSENDSSQELLFLINFTTLIKVPKKFIPLMYDYQKKYNLNQKIRKKIVNNFEQKNKKHYEFMLVNFRVQNNNIKNYIKNLDLLYENIYQQLNELQKLNDLIGEFNDFIYLNKIRQSQELSQYENLQTSESVKENDFVYKMIKEINNILDITWNLISIASSNDILQAVDIQSINEEPACLVFSGQKVAFANNI